MCLECELVSYDEESCYMIGKIINISADESVVTENNKIDILHKNLEVFDDIDYIKKFTVNVDFKINLATLSVSPASFS